MQTVFYTCVKLKIYHVFTSLIRKVKSIQSKTGVKDQSLSVAAYQNAPHKFGL